MTTKIAPKTMEFTSHVDPNNMENRVTLIVSISRNAAPRKKKWLLTIRTFPCVIKMTQTNVGAGHCHLIGELPGAIAERIRLRDPRQRRHADRNQEADNDDDGQ